MHEKRPTYRHRKRFTDGAAFTQSVTIRHLLPMPLVLLCRLTEVSPQQLITDFTDNLSCGTWKREGRDAVKEKLIDYFLEHGYGQRRFSSGHIAEMFREMDAVGMLYPLGDSAKGDLYCEWREQYFQWWFQKWNSQLPL